MMNPELGSFSPLRNMIVVPPSEQVQAAFHIESLEQGALRGLHKSGGWMDGLVARETEGLREALPVAYHPAYLTDMVLDENVSLLLTVLRKLQQQDRLDSNFARVFDVAKGLDESSGWVRYAASSFVRGYDIEQGLVSGSSLIAQLDNRGEGFAAQLYTDMLATQARYAQLLQKDPTGKRVMKDVGRERLAEARQSGHVTEFYMHGVKLAQTLYSAAYPMILARCNSLWS